MKPIWTIGYEGASPEDFDATLRAAGIDVLIDVRAVAISRRPGFSKTALSDRVEGQGIAYLHLRGLGDPKPGREAARSGNMALFRTIFATHLSTPEAQIDLETLKAVAGKRRVALLCFESDAGGCHRTIVANEVANSGNVSIVHLAVERGRAAKDGQSRTDHHSGESLAAA
jgi:uncharacterized protein (DUF488 family)